MAWHERKYAGAALRLAGLALLALALDLGRHLFAVADPAAKLRPQAYLLAMLWLISLSAGAALTLVGRHWFDQIELPARWRIHVPPRGRSAKQVSGDLR